MKKTFNSWSILFYPLSIIFFISYLMSSSKFVSWNWLVFESSDISIVLSFNFNIYSIIFVFTVSSVFASVYHYSLDYMDGEISVKRFLLTLISFAVSMIFLICSGNMFTTLIGWDGLGVTSMMLIMYYCSNASLKASMYTFIINRLGDCFFLILIFMFMCKTPSLNVMIYDFNTHMSSLFCTLLILMSITKSAQVPFSTWLTKAMEAPTPVSSLVHSSTLVTAGIFVLFIYQDVWKESELFTTILSILSLTTVFVASLAGLVEMDLKKIVAYSTLSQLGFIMFTFSISLFLQGFFHLVMHAFFKALMFMGAGYVIHNSAGWQDIRMMTMNSSCSPAMVKTFLTAAISLCGMPFLSGFYSKDYIIDVVLKSHYSIFFMIILIISFFFTLFYSFRVCWYLMKGMKSVSSIQDGETSGMFKSMFYLLTLSCVMGSCMLWTFYPSYPSNDSPKIILVSMLFMGLILFWIWPNEKKSMFYLKTNMYLYILITLIASKAIYFSQKFTWMMDLLSLVGKSLKMPSSFLLSMMEKTKDHSSIMVNFKEVFFFSFLIVLLSVMSAI